jgi:NADH:ubiquinone oxidoreductase subunit 5 (subunit L)/multisubunit Na+/H+ antiporter MnhA subunit
VLAAAFFSRRAVFSAEAWARAVGPVRGFLERAWGFDWLYDRLLVRPTLGAAALAARFDRVVVDGMVNAVAQGTRQVSRFGGAVDNRIVDGLVNGVGQILYLFGLIGRRLQTGNLRTYIALMAAALLGLFLGLSYWTRP